MPHKYLAFQSFNLSIRVSSNPSILQSFNPSQSWGNQRGAWKRRKADEFDFTVSNLAVDLRDGVRLTRLVEVVTGEWGLASAICVPAVSRLQVRELPRRRNLSGAFLRCGSRARVERCKTSLTPGPPGLSFYVELRSRPTLASVES